MALGTVSTANYTRAEIENMLKKAVYSEGKVVWSSANPSSTSFTLSDEVDYVLFKVDSASVKLVRGGSATLKGTYSYRLSSNTYEVEVSYKAEFSTTGTLKYTAGYIRYSDSITPNVTLTGYHYY